MRKHGKNLTVSQKKTLTNNGVKNPDDYLLQKIEMFDKEGYNNLSSDRDKTEVWILINRVTGSIKECWIKE